jgi:hypothetical protein
MNSAKCVMKDFVPTNTSIVSAEMRKLNRIS